MAPAQNLCCFIFTTLLERVSITCIKMSARYKAEMALGHAIDAMNF
ncbi:MAG: hypothetical protein RHS_2562 [Robinsoniella sp. RHS]|nr:MAG: hypothetical protein RHS_2562 [Robinsoniella sp. RHS]